MSNLSRGPATDDSLPDGDQPTRALALMNEALALIDANDGPHDVGAYLDHAICKLRDWIAGRVC